MSCKTHSTTYKSFEEFPIYEGNDLGVSYSGQLSMFKLWSPEAEAVKLRLYEEGLGGEAIQEENMHQGEKGVWVSKLKGNQEKLYYTYQIKHKGQWLAESPDPYSIACGANGQRSMILDWKNAAPIDWDKDKAPPLKKPNDIILYEVHVRDFSIHQSSGIQHKGKFLGFTEQNTQTLNGIKTGIAHLKELGVTHVHLLPSFDFRSLDEELPYSEDRYNWGYDPHLYNVPEGTYSTNAKAGHVRVQEFRAMVQALHQAGIRVILDVVYNHTGATEESVFNQTTPGYYYRQNAEGGFSNASACGNEIASERPMVRQFIVNSVKHWVKNYHIDGFRFDLMGIHDIETMQAVRAALDEIDPNIFVYGEGWLAGDSPLAEDKRATKANVSQLNGVAAFSDEIRDGLKGHVFTQDARGFVSGLENQKMSVQYGIVGGINHPQIDFSKVNYTDKAWASSPSQCIVYTSCHDNHTLWDRLLNSIPKASEAERTQMQQLALGIVLTSQGVPFLHAGSEFCRTKDGVENSYKHPDSTNQIVWTRKEKYHSTFDFVKNMIALRKKHPAFRQATATAVAANLNFLETDNANLIAYQLNSEAAGDTWKQILVYHNGSNENISVDLPKGNWQVVVEAEQVNEAGIRTVKSKLDLPKIGTLILKK